MQDPDEKRVTLDGTELSWEKQMTDPSDPNTIAGVVARHHKSVYKKDGADYFHQMKDQLHKKKNSLLIKGYGWELEYGALFFEKN